MAWAAMSISGTNSSPALKRLTHLVHSADQSVVENGSNIRAAVQLRLGFRFNRLLVKCQYPR